MDYFFFLFFLIILSSLTGYYSDLGTEMSSIGSDSNLEGDLSSGGEDGGGGRRASVHILLRSANVSDKILVIVLIYIMLNGYEFGRSHIFLFSILYFII